MKAPATFAACALLIIGSGAASAATATKPKAATVHSPESIECSKQADAKGLHEVKHDGWRAQLHRHNAGATILISSKEKPIGPRTFPSGRGSVRSQFEI
jgi:ATP-dependent DNA ligase